MLEQHQLRYLERLWKTQDNEVGKKQEPWFYLVLGLCAVFMVFNPFPDWKLGEMSKLISIVYVLLTTISTSILWIMASPSRVQNWKLEQVFDKTMVEMALESSWRDTLRYAIILGVAIGFYIMGSIWASALTLIWLVMKFELKQRWKMFIAYRIREIPNR
jgi:hypothetical protein